MKRGALIFIAVMLLASAAHSQALLVLLFGDKLSTETFQLGINATVTGSDFRGLDGAKTRYSWAFGMFGDIKVSERFRIEPGLTVKTPAGAGDRPDIDLPDDIGGCIQDDSFTLETKMNYLTMPVYFKYFPVPKFNLGIGPQIGYLTGAEDIYDGKTARDLDLEVVQGQTGTYNRWDYGVVGKAEYVFSPQKELRSLRLSFNYYYGLSDIIKDNPGDAIYNSYWLLTLGIPVGGSDAGAEEEAN